MFDLCDKESFEEVIKWKADMDKYCGQLIAFGLVGTKKVRQYARIPFVLTHVSVGLI